MALPPLSILTWNLALLARAMGAPLSWEQGHSEATIRDLVLAESPDIVLFQELPGLVPFVETHDLVPAQVTSHSGEVATLVGNDLATDEEWSAISLRGCAVLLTAHERELTIANVHLAPGKGGAVARHAQLAAIAEHSPTTDLVVLGDTNTRVAELESIEQLGLRTPAPPRPTWDSYRNRFHDGPEFRASFTRCFSRGDVSLSAQRVVDGQIEHEDRSFFLSDHFGLVVDIS